MLANARAHLQCRVGINAGGGLNKAVDFMRRGSLAPAVATMMKDKTPVGFCSRPEGRVPLSLPCILTSIDVSSFMLSATSFSAFKTPSVSTESTQCFAFSIACTHNSFGFRIISNY